ncbi:MAG: substrate-binding domain-containing protein [Thermodesulfobacteriota bacterium]|nr:substrate-binding domain-containing protein [Thermodesulfobacteriota bacterium]
MRFLKNNCLSARTVISSMMILILIFFISSCSQNSDQEKKDSAPVQNKKELLIYCGITMIRPMSEIAAMIENQENCKITITKGGSGNLLKSIAHNKTGDLYLPGSDRYYKIIDEKYPDLVTATEFVGHNKAAIMVQKGNPKKITKDLADLADKHYGVVIGNSDSGSIGKEAKKILEKKGVYKDVIKNVMSLTTDSKDLVKAIKNKEADIVINWFAVSTWDDNPQFMDVIEIDPKYAKKKKLILGLLKYSRYPDIAKKFMDLAGSEKGKELFKKHGLYFD